MKKHKCVKCHMTISLEEHIKYQGLCSQCMIKKLKEIKADGKRNQNPSPH